MTYTPSTDEELRRRVAEQRISSLPIFADPARRLHFLKRVIFKAAYDVSTIEFYGYTREFMATSTIITTEWPLNVLVTSFEEFLNTHVVNTELHSMLKATVLPAWERAQHHSAREVRVDVPLATEEPDHVE